MLPDVPGLVFYELAHRYRLWDEWLPYCVTEVLSQDVSPAAIAAMEKTRHGADGWEARGKAVHLDFANLMRGIDYPQKERWKPWTDALRAEPLLQGVEPLAVEQPLLNKIKRCGGTPDAIFKTADNRVFIADVKTVSDKKYVSGRKAATAQLGAYLEFASSCYHGKVWITDLCTIVVGPGKTKVKFSDPAEATNQWLDSWGRFEARLPNW